MMLIIKKKISWTRHFDKFDSSR